MRDAVKDILDDAFHGCAFAALVELAGHCQGWPASGAVKRLTYDLYEDSLRRRGSTGEPVECHETVTHTQRVAW